MANLQDIRRRIRSVKSMQQLTRAMKMVSAAKLRRAQDRVIAARPYATTMSRVFSRLAERSSDYSHPLLDPREDNNYLVVLITADKGLCGAFNTNLIKAAQQFVRDHSGKSIELVTIGRKGRDFFRRRNYPIAKLPVAGPDSPGVRTLEYINITAKAFDHSDAAAIADDIIELFSAEGSQLDKVFLISNDFRSVLSQKVVIKQLLPVAGEAASAPEKEQPQPAGGKVMIDYLYEQPPAEIFGKLLPKYVETQIYHALLESVASEQGARMTAMDSASKNAGDVISDLTLNMNRVRQASITREIIEVVSGAQALK